MRNEIYMVVALLIQQNSTVKIKLIHYLKVQHFLIYNPNNNYETSFFHRLNHQRLLQKTKIHQHEQYFAR